MHEHLSHSPDTSGHFGDYGGRFVAETLISALNQLEHTYQKVRNDAHWNDALSRNLQQYVGRPSPLYHAAAWSRQLGGAQIYFKREDLNHTGSHKINNALAQVHLAHYMGKKRIIAETGAGQHGVATATAAARLGLECVVYMGAEDITRQASNVYKMKLLGAQVVAVHDGSCTLKDALNEALRDWVTNVENTFYVIGSVAGPHPYPMMVRDFQKIIGEETYHQCLECLGKQPNVLVACVGGGSNAIGLFYRFIEEKSVRLIGVEAGGVGNALGEHAAALTYGRRGVLHGMRSYLLSHASGQVAPTTSIAAGLDYPGVGPEHAWLKDCGRAEYVTVTDEQAIHAFHEISTHEGILPALESCHALAYTRIIATKMSSQDNIVVNLSGRGDKDLEQIAAREEQAN